MTIGKLLDCMRWGLCPRRSIPACLFLLSVSVSPGSCLARNEQDLQLETSILLVKPAVVLISDETAANVTVDCGTGPLQRLQPDPIYETGSGFIIHPDGYIATNGHVVTQFFDMNEVMMSQQFLERAVAQACGPALVKLPEPDRKEQLRALAASPANRGKVQLFKRLQVHLSTGEIYGAEIKAYSPAINPEALRAAASKSAAMGKKVEPERSGKDVAIIKIDAHDLPTIRLAASSTMLKLGEQIFVIGYPGVVLNHDFLSRKSQLEASITVGRVSGFKIDVTNRRVIQTDASITWGNSGGPAFNLRGEAIGVATFISTTLEGDQAIQGFNFLIPADSVREFARGIGVTPESDTLFMREWSQGVTAYFAGQYRRSVAHIDAALKIMAGFPDVERLRADAQMQASLNPGPLGLKRVVWFGLAGVASVVLLGVGIRVVRRRRSRQSERAVRFIEPKEMHRRHPIRRRLPGRSGPPRPGHFKR